MTLTWPQLETRRRVGRGLFVAVLAACALATSLPNLYYIVYPMYGTFGFVPDGDNVVGFADPAIQRAGVHLGDTVNYAAMRMDDRYQERFPLIGRKVTFLLDRGKTEHAVTLRAFYERKRWIWSLGSQIAKKTAALVLVIVGTALLLTRPAPLSRGFFLYAIGSTHAPPLFFSFLPMKPYFAVMLVSDALYAGGASAFLWLSLNFGAKRSTLLASYIPIAAFVVSFVLLAVPDGILMLAGKPAGALIDASQQVLFGCYLIGTIAALWRFWKRSAPRGERFALVALTVAGCAMVVYYAAGYIPVDWANTTFFTRILIKNLFEITLIVNIVASLVFAYAIIRGRIVDTGLVVSRIFWYGIVVFAVVAALVLINWAYAPQLASYAVALPFEVVAAVGVGYLFSGFRDIAGALSLAAVDAQAACAEGRTIEEHDALARALGLAQRTRQSGLIAEVRARCAFSAWLWGDDEGFEQHIEALRAALGTRSMRGLAAFARAALNDAPSTGDPLDLPEWRARAALVACARSNDAMVAQQYAREALAAADDSGLLFLRVLALVAVAELCASERDASLGLATELATRNSWHALGRSLHALRSDARDIGLLQPYVDVRLLKIRPSRPALEVNFFTGEVRALGTRIELPDKELELLFTVATAQTAINADELIDSLWPDAEGDAARNNFRVCLHRLRRHTGDPRVVRRIGQAFALHPGATVDLWELQSALAACERSNDGKHLVQLERLYFTLRAGAANRATLGSWFAPFERMLDHRMNDVRRFLETQPQPRQVRKFSSKNA